MISWAQVTFTLKQGEHFMMMMMFLTHTGNNEYMLCKLIIFSFCSNPQSYTNYGNNNFNNFRDFADIKGDRLAGRRYQY